MKGVKKDVQSNPSLQFIMNKNTKHLNIKLARARKNGETEIRVDVPVRNYHSTSGPLTTAKTFPVSIKGKDGEISRNARRNSRERVLLNTNSNGQTNSLTAHEAIDEKRPIIFPGHKYVEYRKVGG